MECGDKLEIEWEHIYGESMEKRKNIENFIDKRQRKRESILQQQEDGQASNLGSTAPWICWASWNKWWWWCEKDSVQNEENSEQSEENSLIIEEYSAQSENNIVQSEENSVWSEEDSLQPQRSSSFRFLTWKLLAWWYQ